MRFIFLFCFCVMKMSHPNAQQLRFIYIQTENKQPFSVRIKEKIFSAASAGYLVIPKLPDGTYALSIGFPNKEWPTQQVEVVLNGKDEGFILKNFAEKGWGLFNMQTLSVAMATSSAQPTPVATVKKKDAFSNALAEVTNSPIEMEIVQTAPPSKRDTQAVITTPLTAMPSVAPAISSIKKQFSYLDSTGRSLVYVSADGSRQDTVRVFIPYPKQLTNQVSTVQDILITSKEPVEVTSADSGPPKPDSIKKEPQSVKETSEPAKEGIIAEKPVAAANDNEESKPGNPGCKALANDDDFLKLRKKMAALPNEDDMIAIAKKAFRTKCYSTMQLKNLGLLFLKDGGRYNFFDVAYEKVSDPANFPALEAQLSDPYYISRFKAMLR